MKIAIFRGFSIGLLLTALYPISASNARADDWGCTVLLCLSNPGGPTEFSECRPPIEKLWSHLAKGRSFPMCSGAGFSTSRPGYDPYYCNDGYQLVTRSSERGQRKVGCISVKREVVSSSTCRNNDRDGGGYAGYQSVRWERVDGKFSCTAQITRQPNIRERPRFIDVTIEGSGRQRVWF